MTGSLGKTKYTPQTIDNFGFDETFMMPGLEIWGYDSASGVLRRVAVNASGELELDTTALDARYVNVTGDTMTGDLTLPDLIMSGGDIYPTADSATAIQINKADGTTNVLNVDTTNARVGIGTTGPEELLHLVGGDIRIDKGEQIEWADENSAIRFTNEATPHLRIKESGSDRLTIQDGNVGIGTTGPTSALEVSTTADTWAVIINDTNFTTDNLLKMVSSRTDIASVNVGPNLVWNRGTGNVADEDNFILLQGTSDSDTTAATITTQIKHVAEDVTHATRKGAIAFYTRNAESLSEKMRITGAGNVGIGATSPSAKLHADNSVADSAQPVIYLDQADVSEEIAEIVSTAGVGNAVELVGAKTLTVTEFIKVTINGNTRYLQAGTIA